MSNNTMHKMVGIGNIHMRMFDGQVLTLTKICHVQDLKEEPSLVGSFESSTVQGADVGIKLPRAP